MPAVLGLTDVKMAGACPAPATLFKPGLAVWLFTPDRSHGRIFFFTGIFAEL